jgi:hypothetical protein
MSTAFQPTLANYGSHAMHDYPPLVPQAARSKAPLNDSRNSGYYRYPSQQQQQQQHHHQAQQQMHHRHQQSQQLALQVPFPSDPSNNSSLSSVTQTSSASRLPTGPSTPASGSIASVQIEGSTSRRGSETLIYHSMQIPKCIAPAGGNLADFAAQVRFPKPSLPSVKANMHEDDMPLLVRVHRGSQPSSIDSLNPQHSNISITHPRQAVRPVPKMGVECPVHNPGDTECHSLGFVVHLPVENVNAANQRARRQ